jgi:hypothetical protein
MLRLIASRVVMLLFLALSCGCRTPREFDPFDTDVPHSPDFVTLPFPATELGTRSREFSHVFCPDHGRVTSDTDKASAERACAAHNARYHAGSKRAGVATTVVVAD